LEHVSPSEEDKTNYRSQVLSFLVDLLIDKEEASLPDLMCTVEKNILMNALGQCNGNIKKASKLLGIKYTTLYEKLKKYNISFRKQPVAN
jgi:transcriptional regulator of acetoin/glycerol metabolism